MKILHFSPVRRSPEILKLHLESLESLQTKNFELTYSFYDDNLISESSLLLKNFISNYENSILHQLDLSGLDNYAGAERWTPELYKRITFIKNKIIEYFLNNGYDYLFFVDSDVIVHPATLNNLISQNKDFCASIFWTHFKDLPTYTPNAWYSKKIGFDLNDLLLFKQKGTYPVDFTGACTLLSKNILSDGVSFEKIPNVSYLGEDKHFCIRAAVMGYQPYVNTEYPAFHIYNGNYLNTAKAVLKNNFNNNYLKNWLDEDWEIKIEKWINPPKKNIFQKVFNKFK